jgi:geranylgeranyl diphosphate synthase, type I
MTMTMPPGVQVARDLVGPAIADAVTRLSPDVRTVAAYHLGLCDSTGAPVTNPAGAGKALRPALVLLSARAAGARPELGVLPAAAVELVHNFSLLHDDIMDGDTERRHRATAWTVFGIGGAILAGDALLVLAQDLLQESPPNGIWSARCLTAAVQRLIAGQGADLAFERRDDVDVAECLEMAGNKTAALMACACSIGAIHVGAPAALAGNLAAFGMNIGLAFQLTDDLLGIWGAPEVTGKPVGSDLRARKKSMPVVAALTSTTDAGRELADLLAKPEPLTEDQVARATTLVEQAGGRDRTEAMADSSLASAFECLERAGLREDVHAEFAGIAGFITARQW